VSSAGPRGLFKGMTTTTSGVIDRFPLLLPVRNSVIVLWGGVGFSIQYSVIWWCWWWWWGGFCETGAEYKCVCVYYCRTYYKAEYNSARPR
jgi:hypothetical protein